MKCPLCGESVKDAAAECACGEPLTPWRTLAWAGEALRRRGLALAGEKDYLGAMVAFLEAALTTPQDGQSLVDAARALYHLDRPDEALRLLHHAEALAPGRGAAVARAIQELKKKRPEDRAATAAAALPPPRPLLALGPLERSRGWFGSGKGTSSPLWLKVLALEQQGRDWRGAASALAEALQDTEGAEALQYALGLGHWQAGDREAARGCFVHCLKGNLPFLNPAAYYLCLHLEEPQRALVALRALEKAFSGKDLEQCLLALRRRLQELGDGDKAAALEWVLGGDKGV
jgi:tetratricopeptide (TPR) repeat protein